MWALSFRVKENNLFTSRTKKHSITLLFYSQNHYEEKGLFHFVNQGIVMGDEKNKKAFFRDLKKDKQIEHIEVNKDFFIATYKEKKTAKRIDALKAVYNPKIIFLKPAIIDKEGWEVWEVASFQRSVLETIVKLAKKYVQDDFQILSLKEKKVTNLTIKALTPDLSKQQEKAIELAVNEGYYGYPRKITLKQLAKIMKISESTYQFHLAKAEQKIIPHYKK